MFSKKKTKRNGNWNHRGSSFYTSHRFVQQLLRELYLNLSFLVLSCKAILWQKSNQIYLIGENRAQCATMNCCIAVESFCHSVFVLLLFFLFSIFLSFSRAESRRSLSGILKSKNFTSLHHHWRNTVHDFRTRDARVPKHWKSVV